MSEDVHWLLPINPAAHPEHMPSDWRTREDATAVWEAIGRSQPVNRWCLRTGYRAMKPGDVIWAYLSRRQELCAVGTVRAVEKEAGDVVVGAAEDAGSQDRAEQETGGQDAAPAEGAQWSVVVAWDRDRTAELCRHPVPREVFGQVPMSVRRAEDASRIIAYEAASQKS